MSVFVDTSAWYAAADSDDRSNLRAREILDQDLSLVDRTCFAVMNRLGLLRVASFDDDFGVYRFGPRRRLAFELLR